MKSFKAIAAQGEITIIRIGPVPADCALPGGCARLEPQDGRYVIGHSETGHHHVIAADGAAVGELERVPEGMRILCAILERPTLLDHLRDYDTHESIRLEPGQYEFRIAREFDPYAGIGRMVRD